MNLRYQKSNGRLVDISHLFYQRLVLRVAISIFLELPMKYQVKLNAAVHSDLTLKFWFQNHLLK